MSYDFILTDSLEKIFPQEGPKRRLIGEITGLAGETVSMQLAYLMKADAKEENQDLKVTLGYPSVTGITMRKTGLVPATLPSLGRRDENYLFTEPCLCPDVLLPLKDGIIRPYAGQWRSIWIDLELTDQMRGQSNPLKVEVSDETRTVWSNTVTVTVIDDTLPKQELIYTEWFHADCLADYYKVEVFSEAHWELMEKFICGAVKRGVNMILTPIFTPPLDTKEGGERTTVQLVGVEKYGDSYSFDFSLLRRFIEMCKRSGVLYLEISHLFTQWGAKHAPKIIAKTGGKPEQIFGWETDASGTGYAHFLAEFLPKLQEVLLQEEVLDSAYFHISDEPGSSVLPYYRAAKEIVEPLLNGCRIMDALSSFDYYQAGVVKHPIIGNDHIEPFLEAKVPGLWTYYCCAQSREVSNQFMSMPSARNRILGVQLYLYRIKGFLHWGYNFYNSQYSISHINPYLITDAGGAFPSGDSFLVYPGEDGQPYDSLRFMVLSEALYDLRALLKLEELTGQEYVNRLIHQDLDYQITFKKYPKEAEYLLTLRERVNRAINTNHKKTNKV